MEPANRPDKCALDEMAQLKLDRKWLSQYLDEMADEGPFAPYCPEFRERRARAIAHIEEITAKVEQLEGVPR